ncbi:DinB family protein [Nocardioides terrisoli]|uniref:DinB family protein n=1 Tax=Nocardioides terrisoli TaxID=3388267 RepID=UPI00287B5D7A|nr:DinB family protein [Nocardioides marmorisolisilvae]
MPIEPDTKDWTWVLSRPCPDCAFDAARATPGRLPGLLQANAAGWREVLAGDDAAVRPADNIWSPLEYACHVRDVHRLFAARVRLMLEQVDPTFANWDQDETAVSARYDEQPADAVLVDLLTAADAAAAAYGAVPDDAWQRTGRRSDGSVFTVDTLGRYHLHDVVHHLWDVGGTG